MSAVFEVFTLFPEAIEQFVSAGLLGKAIDRGLVAVHCTSYREFATDKHRTVDDTPFGGGAGMVIKPEPVVAALEHVAAARGPMHRVLLTPSAPVFDHAAATRLAAMPRIGLLCGRYEGIDDRVREHFVDECFSIGDFVLGGGEVAALVIIEAVARLLDGVLGNPDSAVHESFAAGERGRWLEHPQYTRPAVFRGHEVPPVLLGGDHEAIARWRREASRRRTWALRPDLRRDPARARLRVHPIYLVLARELHEAPGREELIAVARRHGIEGIVLVDPRADVLDAWVAAAAGRPTVAALPDAATIRRRMRRAGPRPSGRDPSSPRPGPWLVQVVGGAARATAHEVAGTPVDSLAELHDALEAEPQSPAATPTPEPTARPLAIWLGEAPKGACDATWRLSGAEDPGRHGASGDRRHGLALEPTIVDVSQPAPPPAALADLALHRLLSAPRETNADPERTPS
jgi:tRNA (guanine-N1)-methyltransferase